MEQPYGQRRGSECGATFAVLLLGEVWMSLRIRSDRTAMALAPRKQSVLDVRVTDIDGKPMVGVQLDVRIEPPESMSSCGNNPITDANGSAAVTMIAGDRTGKVEISL